MKCPKCHYLSFDPEPRCRNCGYTLALDPDLAIHPDPVPEAPLADLALREQGEPPAAEPPAKARPVRRRPPPTPSEPPRARTTAPGPFDLDALSLQDAPDTSADADSLSLFEAETERPASAPPPRRGDAPRERRPAPPPPTSELPLFVKGMGGDAAAPSAPSEPAAAAPADLLVGVPVLAAPPLSVRRAAADMGSRPRDADAVRIGPLDRDLLEGLQRIEHAEKRQAVAQARQTHANNGAEATRRLGAAGVDALLLGGITGGIATATLRWVDLDWERWTTLPVVPLVAFVLLIVVGYLFMFTAASGQTAGKMLMGIRVVDAGPNGAGDERVSVRQALYRSALTVPSVCLFGAGFLPALIGDHRAVHDRLTQTRVVRA